MSRKNRFSPPSGNCTPELKEKAKYVWNSWNVALEKNTKRKGVPVPLRYNKDVLVPVDSVFHSICGWIANNEDWEQQWESVLKRLEVCAHFLNCGVGTFRPTLAWLFENKGTDRQRPIERVLEGKHDYQVIRQSDDDLM